GSRAGSRPGPPPPADLEDPPCREEERCPYGEGEPDGADHCRPHLEPAVRDEQGAIRGPDAHLERERARRPGPDVEAHGHAPGWQGDRLHGTLREVELLAAERHHDPDRLAGVVAERDRHLTRPG